MSLLIYQHYEKQVAVYTDTLATSTDGKALAFCDKSFLIPHLGIVMATTGVGQLAEVWLRRLNGPILAADIDELDTFATKNLQNIWTGLEQHYGEQLETTGTIYHFGWSEKHKQYVRYIYRSDKDFISELYTEKGIGVKPTGAFPDQKCPEGIEGIKDYAEEIRKRQLQLPPKKRIYIGGDLIMFLMTNDYTKPMVSQIRMGKFDGYDDDLKTISGRNHADRMYSFPLIKDPDLTIPPSLPRSQ